MQWLIQGLTTASHYVVTLLLSVVGEALNLVVGSLIKLLILPLLNATIFNPFTLASGTVVGNAAAVVWGLMASVSAGVALVMVTFGAFSRMGLSWGQRRSWSELTQGLAVWFMILVGGWTFLNMLLGISNTATQALIAGVKTTLPIIFAKSGLAVGATLAGASLFVDLLWPLSGLVIVGLLLWAIGVWLMRQVDLVLYAGLLPLMAALGINGNNAPFKWAWSEAMGAVFNQLAMAFTLWMGCQFLTHVPLHATSGTTPVLLDQFYALFLAGTTFTLTARAPRLLAHITGHQTAGSGHLLTGMALGYLGGRGLEKAWKGSKMGQASIMASEGKEANARAQVTNMAGRPSLGERFQQTGVGQGVSNWGRGVAQNMADGLANTSFGQHAQVAAVQHPKLAKIVKNTGAIGVNGVKAMARPVQTAASFAYQPLSTMGHMAAEGVADSHPLGPQGTMARSQEATVFMAEHGVEAAAAHYFGGDQGVATQEGIQQLGHLVNAGSFERMYQNPHSGEIHQAKMGEAAPEGFMPLFDQKNGAPMYETKFAGGAWQQAVYQKTQQSVLQNIPVMTPASPFTHQGGRASNRGTESPHEPSYAY